MVLSSVGGFWKVRGWLVWDKYLGGSGWGSGGGCCHQRRRSFICLLSLCPPPLQSPSLYPSAIELTN